jgi:hypothetical protein
VNGAPAEVDHFFRMTLAENHIVAGMSGIRARRRISAAQRHGHGGVGDRSHIAAVADALKFFVPRLGRNPHLDLDLGVARGPCRGFDAAKRGQIERSLRSGRREGPLWHCRSGINRDVGDGEGGEVGARRTLERGRPIQLSNRKNQCNQQTS